MRLVASQITSLTTVYTTVYSVTDQRKHQSSASLAFVREIHRWPVNSPHKGPVTRKMFPFEEVIMVCWYWWIHIMASVSVKHRRNVTADSVAVKQPWIIWGNSSIESTITLTPYMVFPLFATRFAADTGGILVSFIQPHLFLFDIKCSTWDIYHTDLYGWNV